jgi:hypothetical protein
MAAAIDAAPTCLGDFGQLPTPLSLAILSLLPMPDLMSCASLSHAFQKLTRERWCRVALAPTLTYAAGFQPSRAACDEHLAARTAAFVRGLLRFAGHLIEHLDADDCACFTYNTAALLELLCAEARQRAAGRTLHISMHTVVLETPITPDGGEPVWPVQRVAELLNVIAQHAPLRVLKLVGLDDYVGDDNVVFDALLQALTALPNVESLWLSSCGLPVLQIAACVRAPGARLKTLTLDDELMANWAAEPVGLEYEALADALASSGVETLHLSDFKLYLYSVPYCRRLLASVHSHPTLRTLTLTGMYAAYAGDYLEIRDPIFAAIADIITADAPALQHVRFCDTPAREGNFDDDLLPSIVAALAHNTHLRTITVAAGHVFRDFLDGPLHDAVDASNVLRRLRASQPDGPPCVLLQVVVQPD